MRIEGAQFQNTERKQSIWSERNVQIRDCQGDALSSPLLSEASRKKEH